MEPTPRVRTITVRSTRRQHQLVFGALFLAATLAAALLMAVQP